MGGAVIFVMTIASAVTSVIYHFVLVPLKLSYLNTIVFILVIAALVQFVEMFLKKTIPSLYEALGVYLPLITTNCAVLGVTILAVDEGYNYPEALVAALGAGLGFLLAMVLFSGVRRRVDEAEPPKAFKGMPITLISAALVSLSFMCFAGVADNLFGVL